MRNILLAGFCLAISASPAFAGDGSTAVGVGVGVSKSTSASKAVAISGQGGKGGTGVGVANAGAISPSATVNIAGAPAVQSIHNSGSISNVPAVFAPGLSAAGLETCLGSVSVGASWLGTGLTGGGSIPDPGCAARLDARTLWSMGLKRAAVARLCLNPDIRASMPDVCGAYLPVVAPVGYAAPVPFVKALASIGSPEPEVQTAAYHGGPIMLVEGATGREHLCNSYDEARQKCRLWADAKPRHVAAAKRRHQDPIPAPAIAAAEPPKEDQNK